MFGEPDQIVADVDGDPIDDDQGAVGGFKQRHYSGDEVLAQVQEAVKRIEAKKPSFVNSKDELSAIMNESIKDEGLRGFLLSIIKMKDQDSGDHEKAAEEVVDKEEAENDPYDTLDRHPQPGLDDEIDPYLGQDKPGEFDEYLENNDDQDDSIDEFESSEEGHDDDTDDQKIKNNRLDYDDYEEKENNKNNDCKRLDEMSDQEMLEHFRLVNNMTAEEVFRDDPVMRSSQQMLLDTPDDDDQDPVSVKTSSSYVGTSASTDNDCSSISSDTAPLPQLLDNDDQQHTSHPPLQTLSRLSSVSTAPLHDDEQDARDAVAPDGQLSQSGVASPSQDNTKKVATLEKSVATLQSMGKSSKSFVFCINSLLPVLGLSAQVDTLTNKMDDSSFESGLLNKTVEMLQEKNTRLTQSLGTLEAR